ncbi:type II toxin-antitoxin system RelE/ParE family toxin [Buttiauxella gaviniae]|uniref:type II toxin-antitoxin system RelE/ParE family toxin n=1 Tax=Buttiauxella gaviniae TaxID=82990 RepID=UPI000943F5EB
MSVVHSPRMGRENSEIAEGVPGVDYRLHAIFYRIRDNDIFILRILHHKMEPLVHFSEL